MAAKAMRIIPYHPNGVVGIAFIIAISSCVLSVQVAAQTIATEEEADIQEGEENPDPIFDSGVEHKNAEQRDKHLAVANDCLLREITESPPDDCCLMYCNLTFNHCWDCWNYTRAGEVAVHPCPWYIPASNSQKNATIYCMPNGELYMSAFTDQTWTNYSACCYPVKKEVCGARGSLSGTTDDTERLKLWSIPTHAHASSPWAWWVLPVIARTEKRQGKKEKLKRCRCGIESGRKSSNCTSKKDLSTLESVSSTKGRHVLPAERIVGEKLQVEAQTIATEEEGDMQEGEENPGPVFGMEHKNAEQRDKHLAVAYDCLLREITESPPDDGFMYCNLTFDHWDCWNYTRAGEVAIHPCPWWIPASDSQQNATKYCMPNGEWYVSAFTNQTWTNYSACYNPVKETNVMVVFYVGYSVSIIALSIALFIFFYFKTLSCPRVTIHKNLFFSFIFDALFQITFFAYVASNKDTIQRDGVYCKIHNVLKQYFQLCNYFWMLSEGLYLHTVIVVAVFSAENHQLVPYFVIGWAIPIIPACLYAGFVAYHPPGPCWVGGTPFEWLIAGFVIFVLAVNLILLLNIVRVLVTKLRATPMCGSQNYIRAVRATLILISLLALMSSLPAAPRPVECDIRAVRATLILLPLLGLHYIILPAAPPPGLAAVIYSYVMAVILSFQGLFVACIFCFFNGEVKMQVRRKWFAHHWWRRDSDFRGRYANTTTVTEACTVTAPVNNRIGGGDQGCPLLKKSPNFIGNGSTPGGSQRSSCSSGGSLAVKYRPGSGASTVSKTPEIEEIPEVKMENCSYKMNGDIGDNAAIDDDMVDVVCPLMESVELNTRTTEV